MINDQLGFKKTTTQVTWAIYRNSFFLNSENEQKQQTETLQTKPVNHFRDV